MSLGKELGLSPCHIMLDGDPVGTKRLSQQPIPTFRRMSIVAKRSPISATAELLFSLVSTVEYACRQVQFLPRDAAMLARFWES